MVTKYKVSPYVTTLSLQRCCYQGQKDSATSAIGHFGILARAAAYGEFRFNVDGTSQANFDRGTVAIGMTTDYSLTELSKARSTVATALRRHSP